MNGCIRRLLPLALALPVCVAAPVAPALGQSPGAERSSADSLYRRGVALLETAQVDAAHDEAIATFYRAIGADLDYAPAYVGLSTAYLSKAPWDGEDRIWVDVAIAFGEKAVFLAPDDAAARIALGEAYLAKRWYRQALPHFERAYALEPTTENAQRIAWLGIETGDLDVTIRTLERIRAATDTTTLDMAYAMAFAYRPLGEYDRADRVIRRMLRERPGHQCVNSMFLFTAIEQGDVERVLAHADSLVRRDPQNRFRLVAAGLGYWYAGRDSLARAHFERALEKTGDERMLVGCWGTYLRTPLADILWRAGERERARELFAHSMEGYEARLRDAAEGWGYMFDMARVHASMGDKAQAYHWLREAIRFGWHDASLARYDPALAGLRDEAEFNRLLMQVEQKLERQRRRVAARP